MNRHQRYRAGPEAAQTVLDHEAQRRAVSEAILIATGLKSALHGEIVLIGGKFYGYRPIGRMLPGFRASRKAGDQGLAVLALRTTTGKLIRSQLARVPKMPEPEDLTLALCGEPWCLVTGAGRADGRNLRSYTYAVERQGDDIIVVGPASCLPPRGCARLDESGS